MRTGPCLPGCGWPRERCTCPPDTPAELRRQSWLSWVIVTVAGAAAGGVLGLVVHLVMAIRRHWC